MHNTHYAVVIMIIFNHGSHLSHTFFLTFSYLLLSYDMLIYVTLHYIMVYYIKCGASLDAIFSIPWNGLCVVFCRVVMCRVLIWFKLLFLDKSE